MRKFIALFLITIISMLFMCLAGGCAAHDPGKLPTDAGDNVGTRLTGSWAHSVSASYNVGEAQKLIDQTTLVGVEGIRAFLTAAMHEIQSVQNCLTEAFTAEKKEAEATATVTKKYEDLYNSPLERFKRFVIGCSILIIVGTILAVVVMIFFPSIPIVGSFAAGIVREIPIVGTLATMAAGGWANRKQPVTIATLSPKL